MASLSELYAYLEEKRDSSHIDRDFPWFSFPDNEREESRFEILTWWKIERIVEDENCPIDKMKAIVYFDRRMATTNNQFLVYRYSYFAYLLSNNRTYAEKAVDALIGSIDSLLPRDTDDYPSRAIDAIEALLTLSKRIKYRQADSKTLIWNILDGNYGCRTKIVILEDAQLVAFFHSSDAERIAEKCRQLIPDTTEHWTEICCSIGLHYAAKIQAKGKSYFSWDENAIVKREHKEGKQSKDEIISSFRTQLGDLRNDHSFITALEQSLDLANNGIMEKARRHLKNEKEIDFSVLTLLLSGFSIKSISYLLRMSEASLRMRKTRFKQQFEIMPEPLRSLFLDKIG